MQPWIRRYNYISDYYDTAYNIYSKVYPGYPVTYYSVDWKNSVYDKKLMAGSYEKNGIGSLTGIEFKKILLLPVFGIEQITPVNTGSERGLTMHDSETSTVTFSSEYGLKPYEWDVIHFSQDFMSPDNNDDSPVFVVRNTNPATYGNMTMWQCSIKVAPYRLGDVKKQISSEYMFLDFTKSIHRLDTAYILIQLQQRSNSLSDNLKDLFHSTGFYLQEV
jgi:hypothetical protein